MPERVLALLTNCSGRRPELWPTLARELHEILRGWCEKRCEIKSGAILIAFGYRYWTCGLESAMLAHFSGDMILIVSSRFFGT